MAPESSIPPLSAVLNFYAGSPLDRMAALRTDEDAVAALLAHPDSLFVPVWRGRHLVSEQDGAPRAAFPAGKALNLSPDEVAALPWALLGFDRPEGDPERRPLFALGLDPLDLDPAEPAPDFSPLPAALGRFSELRPVAAELEPEHASILAHARGMLHWRATHRFCGICGAPTRPEHGGHRLSCLNNHQHFPRTDPAVIMLVHHQNRILMARNVRFGERRVFSVLAGFVEPGESLEEAVAREVWEETGIRVADVRYHSSQPWPFPGSIMLGFSAEALSPEIAIDGEEIVEAFWATPDQLRSPDAHDFLLPGRGSIALRMIQDWLGDTPTA
jgi:NAD+ diphosphatase